MHCLAWTTRQLIIFLIYFTNDTIPHYAPSKASVKIYSLGDGIFDESGYEIDHIEEFSINNSASPHDSDENLQALCLMFKYGQNETVQSEKEKFEWLDWLKQMNI